MALLGADEFAFGTLPLIVLGCVMMRKCNTNTCPVGVATQNPELRKKFRGHYEYVVNYFTFLAQEVREYLAAMGFHSLNEIIGRTDLIEMKPQEAGSKSDTLDFSRLLHTEGDPQHWDGRAFTHVDDVKDFDILADTREAVQTAH